MFYKSKDGTKVPMFIVRKRSTLESLDDRPQKPIPTILHGYGGFNESITPHFRSSILMFLKIFNGMYCVANVRGGGEFGENWHKQGIKEKR